MSEKGLRRIAAMKTVAAIMISLEKEAPEFFIAA